MNWFRKEPGFCGFAPDNLGYAQDLIQEFLEY